MVASLCRCRAPEDTSRSRPDEGDTIYAEALLRPWYDALARETPGLALLDAHTHVGTRDPGGFTATTEELLGSLRLCGARAVVFPMVEPGGYREPNLRCAREAAASGGVLTAFARLAPDQEPAAMLAKALAAGARGIKLHPFGDGFDLLDPRLEGVFSLAHERRLPVVLHAGPELGSIGATVLSLCGRFPGMRVVMAHCALTDLMWLWRHVPATPNLFFDTSWWSVEHVMALLRLVPPGRILLASDLPYGTPLQAAVCTLRCAVQAGLDADQLRCVAGGQLARLLAGEDPLELGPAPAQEARAMSPVLDVLTSSLYSVLEPMQRGADPGTALDVVRHACRVADDDPDADVVASVRHLLDLYDERRGSLRRRNQFTPGRDLVLAAAFVARTPAAPLP